MSKKKNSNLSNVDTVVQHVQTIPVDSVRERQHGLPGLPVGTGLAMGIDDAEDHSGLSAGAAAGIALGTIFALAALYIGLRLLIHFKFRRVPSPSKKYDL